MLFLLTVLITASPLYSAMKIPVRKNGVGILFNFEHSLLPESGDYEKMAGLAHYLGFGVSYERVVQKTDFATAPFQSLYLEGCYFGSAHQTYSSRSTVEDGYIEEMYVTESSAITLFPAYKIGLSIPTVESHGKRIIKRDSKGNVNITYSGGTNVKGYLKLALFAGPEISHYLEPAVLNAQTLLSPKLGLEIAVNNMLGEIGFIGYLKYSNLSAESKTKAPLTFGLNMSTKILFK